MRYDSICDFSIILTLSTYLWSLAGIPSSVCIPFAPPTLPYPTLSSHVPACLLFMIFSGKLGYVHYCFPPSSSLLFCTLWLGRPDLEPSAYLSLVILFGCGSGGSVLYGENIHTHGMHFGASSMMDAN